MAESRRKETLSVVLAALFTALIAVLAQIPPTTHEFPITLQTFALALCGYTLTVKYSLFSVVAYILLGAVGAPVFSGLCGGLHHITGPAGGFIIAFPIFVVLCAFSSHFKPFIVKIAFGVLGLLLLYSLGVLWFSFITKNPLWTAIVMYAPVLLKDLVSTVFALYFSSLIKKRLLKKSA